MLGKGDICEGLVCYLQDHVSIDRSKQGDGGGQQQSFHRRHCLGVDLGVDVDVGLDVASYRTKCGDDW